MKRLLFIVLAMIATITSFAQQKDVTSFLGIPVDGTDVRVYIATNNNKVCRIMLCDENYQNETNTLIPQHYSLTLFISA